VRRHKSYSAASGYVYQYFYEGYRAAGPETEFVFQASADRKAFFPVSVVLPDAVAAQWEREHRV
jgi:hypothetical protein